MPLKWVNCADVVWIFCSNPTTHFPIFSTCEHLFLVWCFFSSFFFFFCMHACFHVLPQESARLHTVRLEGVVRSWSIHDTLCVFERYECIYDNLLQWYIEIDYQNDQCGIIYLVMIQCCFTTEQTTPILIIISVVKCNGGCRRLFLPGGVHKNRPMPFLKQPTRVMNVISVPTL